MTTRTAAPIQPLLDWSYEKAEGEDFTVAYKPRRKQAGPLPLLIPYRPSSRPWVAEITGRDETYKYARVFIEPSRSHAGRTYTLQPGRIYEVSEGHGDRHFVVPPMFEGDKQLTLAPEEAAFFFSR